MPLTNPGSAVATATAINSFSGGATTNQTLTANTAATIAAKPDRKYLMICNTGTATVRMALGTAATGSLGIPIEAGGNFEFNATNLFLGTVSLFSTVAGSVAIIEA